MVSYREKNKDSEVKIPSFKYSKKDLKKYEGLLQIILVVLTAALLIAMVVWMVSMMNKNARKDNNKDVDRDAIVSPVPLESDDEETQQSTEDTNADGELPTLNEGRITSYNVCYTKLLRNKKHFKHILTYHYLYMSLLSVTQNIV